MGICLLAIVDLLLCNAMMQPMQRLHGWNRLVMALGSQIANGGRLIDWWSGGSGGAEQGVTGGCAAAAACDACDAYEAGRT